jgi:outer membrane protein assembly factor BamB
MLPDSVNSLVTKFITEKKIWSKHLKNDFKGTFTRHGHSESPLIFEDKVYLCAGGAEHNVVALNRFSGELIWSSPGKDERPGYNTPNIIQLKTERLCVCFFCLPSHGF